MEQSYAIFDPDPLKFVHADITLNPNTPTINSLCGNIVVTAQYDGNDIAENEPVMSYVAANKEFIVDSDDTSLIDQKKPYSLTAKLQNYPSTTRTFP